jgi:hypothetical protein
MGTQSSFIPPIYPLTCISNLTCRSSRPHHNRPKVQVDVHFYTYISVPTLGKSLTKRYPKPKITLSASFNQFSRMYLTSSNFPVLTLYPLVYILAQLWLSAALSRRSGLGSKTGSKTGQLMVQGKPLGHLLDHLRALSRGSRAIALCRLDQLDRLILRPVSL